MRRGIPSFTTLQAFEAAARLGSFSEAASELHQTHGAISKRVAELESYLGVQLFDRVRQRIILSTPGAEYARRIRVHLDQIRRDTVEVVRQRSSSGFEVAMGIAFAFQWMVPRLEKFHADNPGIQVKVQGRDSLTFFDNSNFDAVIYFDQKPWVGMPSIPLIQDDEIVAVAAPMLVRSATNLSLEEICRLPWIHTWDLPRTWGDWLESAGAPYMQHSSIDHNFDLRILAIGAALAGLGVALLPRILVDRELRSGSLFKVSSLTMPNPDTIFYSFPEQRRGSDDLNRFTDWLISEVRTYQSGVTT